MWLEKSDDLRKKKKKKKHLDEIEPLPPPPEKPRPKRFWLGKKGQKKGKKSGLSLFR